MKSGLQKKCYDNWNFLKYFSLNEPRLRMFLLWHYYLRFRIFKFQNSQNLEENRWWKVRISEWNTIDKKQTFPLPSHTSLSSKQGCQVQKNKKCRIWPQAVKKRPNSKMGKKAKFSMKICLYMSNNFKKCCMFFRNSAKIGLKYYFLQDLRKAKNYQMPNQLISGRLFGKSPNSNPASRDVFVSLFFARGYRGKRKEREG